VPDTTLFQAVGGTEGVLRLAQAWHRRVMADEFVAHAFSHGFQLALRQVLHEYFAWATTKSMAAYPESADEVPNGLRLRHWSWEGLQP
jgi:hypothetical protein